MADVKISDLPAGTAAADAIVPATNAAGTTTEKVTMGAIAALGGGPPAAHKTTHATGGTDALAAADIGAAAASHTHGNITNAGAIGTTSGLPVKTGTSGVLEAGAFGTASGTFCEGNDARLSDSRTPTAHESSHRTGGGDPIANVVVSPAEITANTNNYAIGTGDIFRLTADAARNITGIVARNDGDAIVLINVDSTDAITLKHASTDSTDVNRILVPWEGDYVLAAKGGAALLIYDGTTDRWRVI
jgi:hypothetical protein